jgi:hypothetical protein
MGFELTTLMVIDTDCTGTVVANPIIIDQDHNAKLGLLIDRT